MPTGYTHSVQTGEITDFPSFAMQCARAFGALIMMRDDPSDAPVPERFEPSEFNRRAIGEAIDRLQKLNDMSPSEAQRAAQQDHAAAMARWRERSIEDAQQRVRYQAMIDKVIRWQEPSTDHTRLKEFMLEQLLESVRFDCGGKYNPYPRIQRWPDWLEDQRAKAIRDMQYHQKADAEELQRTESRNQWVLQLRASLVHE